jgi:hypothetical protein
MELNQSLSHHLAIQKTEQVKKGLNIFLLPTKVTFFAFPFLQITKLRVLEFAETKKWTFDITRGLKTYLTRNRKYMYAEVS